MRKPKTIIYLTCSINTARSLARPEKGEMFGRLFQEAPQRLVPMQYGFWHPYRDQFIAERAAEQLSSVWRDKGSNGAYLWWRGRVKGYMHIDTKRWDKVQFHSIGMHIEYNDLVRLNLLDAHHRLFQGLVALADAAYGGVTVRSAFRGDDWYEGYKPEVVERGGVPIMPNTGGIQTDVPSLSPGLHWLTVFGREHLDALGDQVETLAEVGKTWRDEGGRLWVQAADRPEKMHLPETRERIQRVIDRIAASPAGRREPVFDRSEIYVPPPEPDNDPFSMQMTHSGFTAGKHSIQTSRGYSRQIQDRPDLDSIARDLLRRAMGKREFYPLISAVDYSLKTNDPGYSHPTSVIRRSVRRSKHRSSDDITPAVEQLVRLNHEEPLKAAGICARRRATPPGASTEQETIVLHLEQASGEAFKVHFLPSDNDPQEPWHGVLLVEPEERVIFTAEEWAEDSYFLGLQRRPIPWAKHSERIAFGATLYYIIADLIVAALEHHAEIEPFGVTMLGGKRYLRMLKEPEKYRTQEAVLSAVIRLIRGIATKDNLWGAGWCVVEASSGSEASGVLRMHVESRAEPRTREPAAFDVSLPFRKKERKIELEELHAERSEFVVFK